ncbi:hypothetical protein ACFL4T_05845 [candidate division KSB1 bacterium]
MRERAKGKENFEVKDFFNDSLQENIINNFDGKISRAEYESVIMEMFGLKKISKDKDLTKAKLEGEIEEIIVKYKIKTKRIIIQKMVETLSDGSYDFKQIAEIVENKYTEVVSDIVRSRLRNFPKNRLPDIKKFTGIFKKENYEISEGLIKKVYNEVKSSDSTAEKTVIEAPEEVVVDEPIIKEASQRTGKSSAAEEMEDIRKQKILDQFELRTKNRKLRFINLYCKSWKFASKGEEVEGDKSYLVYSGSFQGRFGYLKVYKPQNKIENILIHFSYEMKKKRYSILIDMVEFNNLRETHQEKQYIQSRVKSLATFFGFSNFYEALWFLTEILTREHNVPKYIFDYLEENIINYLNELDATLTKFLAMKAIK